jgi:hypothetical protein
MNFHTEKGREVGQVRLRCPVERWTRQIYKPLAQTDTVRQRGLLIRCAHIKLDVQVFQGSATGHERLNTFVSGQYRTIPKFVRLE